jgi:hypothetical protein
LVGRQSWRSEYADAYQDRTVSELNAVETISDINLNQMFGTTVGIGVKNTLEDAN